MSKVAFAPKSGVELDGLGAVFVNDYQDANVRALVENSTAPDGAFVVEDDAVIAVLDKYENLKRVSLESAEPKTEAADKAKPVPARDAKSKSEGGA